MHEDRSLLGLDEPQSIAEKLGLFLSALLIGMLVGPLIFLGIQHLEPRWRTVGLCVSESLAAFWVCLLVFIWWRPAWFRRIYLSVERKVVLAVQIIVWVCVIGFAIVCLRG